MSCTSELQIRGKACVELDGHSIAAAFGVQQYRLGSLQGM